MEQKRKIVCAGSVPGAKRITAKEQVTTSLTVMLNDKVLVFQQLHPTPKTFRLLHNIHSKHVDRLRARGNVLGRQKRAGEMSVGGIVWRGNVREGSVQGNVLHSRLGCVNEHPKLIIRSITFEVTQPIRPQIINVTERRTDNLRQQYRTLRYTCIAP